MPALKNRRHEQFAIELAKGLGMQGRYPSSQSAAWTRAGGTSNRASAKMAASRLLRAVPAIVERVKELQGEAATAAKTSLEAVVERLDIASAMAERIEQPSAITAAETAKAKLLGLEPPQKQEVGSPGSFDGLISANSTKDFTREYLRLHLGIAPESLTDDLIQQATALIRQHYDALEALLPQTGAVAITQDNQNLRPH